MASLPPSASTMMTLPAIRDKIAELSGEVNIVAEVSTKTASTDDLRRFQTEVFGMGLNLSFHHGTEELRIPLLNRVLFKEVPHKVYIQGIKYRVSDHRIL